MRRSSTVVGFAWCSYLAVASYDCSGVESIGEVQGETGSICAPRCTGDAYACPTDVPAGVTAQPQCMLQDVNQVAYCGLLCTSDTQCPSGASCRRVGELGLCIHPLSFKEWAGSQVQRTKLTVGYPAKAVQSAKSGSFKIAKAYAALQSMKRRFGIADGDADVLIVKELLQAASAQVVNDGPAVASGSGGISTASAAVGTVPQHHKHHHIEGTDNGQGHKDFGSEAFEHDVNYFVNNMANGPAGVEKELQDTVWNLEHLGTRGVCTELLRSVLLLGLVYLCGGSFYKHQTLGATGMDMIPHVGFWMEYPALVNDGIAYAMMVGNECLGGRPVPRAGGIGGQPGDRDTFAHFEPIK